MNWDFDSILRLIKSGTDYLAVDQLGDDFIFVSASNASFGGERLKLDIDKLRSIRNGIHELIDKECIVLRHRPLGGLEGFQADSMVAFFDIWRSDVDGEKKAENKAFAI